MQNCTDTSKYKTKCYCILCTYLRDVSREIINTTFMRSASQQLFCCACFTICIVCFVLFNCYFAITTCGDL